MLIRQPDISCTCTLHTRSYELDFDEVTRLVGFKPTSVFRQRRPELLRQFSYLSASEWSFELRRRERECRSVLQELSDWMIAHREGILRATGELDLGVDVVCTVSTLELEPSFFLPPSLLRPLAEFIDDFAFDFYDYRQWPGIDDGVAKTSSFTTVWLVPAASDDQIGNSGSKRNRQKILRSTSLD